MTPSDIKSAMLKRGITQQEIADISKSSRQRINEVINGKSSNLAIRQAVADAIAKPLMDVFPDEAYRRPSGRIRIPSAYYQAAMASA